MFVGVSLGQHGTVVFGHQATFVYGQHATIIGISLGWYGPALSDHNVILVGMILSCETTSQDVLE